MALILSIDVSGKTGLVTIGSGGKEIDYLVNSEPMQHASFLQPAVSTLLKRNDIVSKELKAISICNGPGSYTGLRVGLSSAKGLCFALGIPLITVNSLQLISMASKPAAETAGLNAFSNSERNQPEETENKILYCPMIDARRMEVFFGLYNEENSPVIIPKTAILEPGFLSTYLAEKHIIFTGSGAEKWENICQHENAIFIAEPPLNTAFNKVSYTLYEAGEFAHLAMAEPFYCKSFYNVSGVLKPDT